MNYDESYLSDERKVGADYPDEYSNGTIWLDGTEITEEAYEAIKSYASKIGWEKQTETQVTD